MIAHPRRNEAAHCDYRSRLAEVALGGVAEPAACDPPREFRGQPHRPRLRRDIERAANVARHLRPSHCAELAAPGLRRIRKHGVARKVLGSGRAIAAASVLLLTAAGTFSGFVLSSVGALAQEKIAVATGPSGSDAATDQARLAEFRLGLTAIEQCEDVALLWRAVRELVLPQRISVSIQQRILRRVWAIDPDIANGSRNDSDFN